MIRLDNQPRVFRMIDEAIERLGLNLSGLRVLTEAASGAFVVTALTAARAGADRVHAVARDSSFGSVDAVIEYGREWAEALGVSGRINFTTAPAADCASQAHIVTNLGFVRPIDRALVSRLPKYAVVSLMFEPWEFRPQDIDLDACATAGIPVIGTRETDPRLRIFDYVGIMVVKLLLESGLEVFRSRVLLIGSDPFGREAEAKLAALGADVQRVPLPEPGTDLDPVMGGLAERADALVLVEHRDRRQLIGNAGGIRPERFRAGCRVVHVAGTVDEAGLKVLNIPKHPAVSVRAGYMTVATDYAGPRPVIELHTAGLAVGALAVRCRLAGGSQGEAIAAAEASGLGVRFAPTLANVHP